MKGHNKPHNVGSYKILPILHFEGVNLDVFVFRRDDTPLFIMIGPPLHCGVYSCKNAIEFLVGEVATAIRRQYYERP